MEHKNVLASGFPSRAGFGKLFRLGDDETCPSPQYGRGSHDWLLSKEGQIAYYYASFYAPIHKDLQRREFIPFAEEIIGKKVSFWYKGEGEGERELEAKLHELWNPLWLGGSRKVR